MAIMGFGLVCVGCLLLSLSLRRHYRQVFADPSGYEGRLWPLRTAGYACLALALWPCVRASGPAVGLILWMSMVALAAFLQILLLTYRPQRSVLFGGFGVALVLAGLLA